MSVVVLMSGGLDSTVCAEMALRDGVLAGCVFVDYGHPARQAEAWRAFAWAERRGVRLHVLHAMGLCLGGMDGRPGSSAQFVPARNAILISMAANVAASWKAESVWIGATAADLDSYPDCRGDFLIPMCHALLKGYGVTVKAPLIGMTRREVSKLARDLGVRRRQVWSCYGPGPEPCGECASCRQ